MIPTKITAIRQYTPPPGRRLLTLDRTDIEAPWIPRTRHSFVVLTKNIATHLSMLIFSLSRSVGSVLVTEDFQRGYLRAVLNEARFEKDFTYFADFDY